MSADETAARRPATERPLSPHISIYRPQFTSIMSILHRVTGIWLAIGVLVLVWWLVAAASGPAAFALVRAILGSWVGLALLFFWSLALFYHLLNGVRHLLWDAGWGFDLPTAYATARSVFIGAAVLTFASWGAGILLAGG